jgi:uncharacterized protein YgbK (DUF1537 family)
MWLIVADDLTGAADCAIAFARRGVASSVGWGSAIPADPVFAYDAASRYLRVEQAAAVHRAVFDRLAVGRRLFVKIDSTLRGQPAAVIRSTLAVLPSALAILAPAFPAAGRTTVRGHVLVNGQKLECSEVWQHDHTYRTGQLTHLLGGVPTQSFPLGAIRSPDLAQRFAALPSGTVAICDAVEQADLDRIATAGQSDRTVFVGSAGLAHALAGAKPLCNRPVPLPRSRGGTLILVGSLAAASRAAARTLAAQPGVRHVPLTLDSVPDPALVAAALAAGEDVLVELAAANRPLPGVVGSVAEALRAVVDRAGSLVASGGETASALLTTAGVHGIRLVDELEPGVALGLTVGRLNIPVVTKAGAFGDESTLVRIVERLRSLREGAPT